LNVELFMATTYQNQATMIVNEQLEQLRSILFEVQAQLSPATLDLRQIARTLDELYLRSTHGAANTILMRQIKQLEERRHALEREVAELKQAARGIEQLIRQIEISSAALKGDNVQSDPWELALKAQIIQGREDERIRLAREIHDSPAQVLAHALLGLEYSITLVQQGNHARLLELLSHLRDSSRSALHEIRRLIADLRPPALENQGLDAAISDLCAHFEASGMFTVRCDGLPLPQLPAEQAIVIYRIVQEALNNAAKHAPNATITVRYGAAKGRLVLIISLRVEKLLGHHQPA
jgi:two-component system sensor histidine kinase DegS